MNKFSLKKGFIYGFVALSLLQSCDGDNDDTPPPPAPIPDQSFTQSFDDMAAATAQGWVFKNLSDDTGDPWVVQDETDFYGDPPFDGANLLYSNYLASAGFDGNISNWAISPARIIQNGDKISFYTLSNGTLDGYADRLQLRLNVFNTSDSVGETSTSVGGFLRPLVDINATYSTDPTTGYPTNWTKYEATVVGLNKPDSGRFALRYFVELHGGSNGDELAVDKVEYISASHP
jgi:hypothetical protein